MSVIAHSPNNTLVIGEVSHYHFYQSMNHTRPAQKYQPRKPIIPSVPRQHCKAPINSPLSFIRQEKLPQPNQPTQASAAHYVAPPITSTAESIPKQRPPLLTHSTTDLLKNMSLMSKKDQFSRRRKVSFDENVMVICTRFNGDDDDDDNTEPPLLTNDFGTPYSGRRHSTGDYLTNTQRQRKHWLTLLKSLKRWKYALPAQSSSSSSSSVV